MLKNLHISNFKSIYDETIKLGRFNVFIGENGSGKTNILEALGMASAAAENKLSNDELALKGIRVTKPAITFSSFLGERQKKEITVNYIMGGGNTPIKISTSLNAKDVNNIFSKWGIKKEAILLDENGRLVDINSFFTRIKNNMLEREEENEEEQELKKLLIEDSYLFNGNKKFPLFSREHLLESAVSGFIRGGQVAIGIKFYQIFNLSTQILRGIGGISREVPGIRGENLDRLIESFGREERAKLEEYAYFINWLDKIEIDKEDRHKLKGHKLDMSTSILYFRDKYMQRKNNLFSAENANEGVLHILFYLALFISKHTPKLFAIDNIETALNPELCKKLIEQLVKLSKEEGNERQVLITTHSPSVLDGLNLHDDEQRLFKVYRNKKGHTKVKRIQLKPNQKFNGQNLKLSELWMRNYIGAIPQNL